MADSQSSMRSQIIEAASRLFRLHGFHATSVRDIAEAVGMQGGSLYAHVRCKDDLLWEIVDVAAYRFFEALEPVLQSEAPVMDRLRLAAVSHVAVVTSDLDAAAVYMMEWRHLSKERLREATRRRDDYERLFRSLVEEAMRDGSITAVNASSAGMFILSTLNYVFSWYHPAGRLSPQEVGEMLAGYVFDGLKKRPD